MPGLELAPDQLNQVALWFLYLGLFGWIASAAGFIYKGFDRKGRMNLKKALPWFAAIFIFMAVFIAGLVFLGVG